MLRLPADLYDTFNTRRYLMKSSREKVGVFLKRYPLPQNWSESLKGKLPDAGNIETYIRLILVTDNTEGKEGMLFSLTAHEVCTERECTMHNLTPPNGKDKKWADVVPELVGKMLVERLALQILRAKLRDIPKGWEIQYEFTQNETAVGGPA